MGRKKPNISKVEVIPGWSKNLSFGGLLVAYHGRAMGQIEKKTGNGRDRARPGPGRAAQAGRRLAVQLRRYPLPAPVLWARGALRPRGAGGKGASLSKPQARPLLPWALPSCVKKGGARGMSRREGRADSWPIGETQPQETSSVHWSV